MTTLQSRLLAAPTTPGTTGAERMRPVHEGPERPAPWLLTVPAATAPTVARPRVMELLDQAIRHPVTLVSGGPGSGKTVAVADWILRAEPPHPVVWVSLTSGEADPERLWSTIRKAARVVLDDVPPAAGWGPVGPLEEGLGLFASLGRREVLLVLDDVCLVEGGGGSLRLLDAVLRRPPTGLHLVLISRHDPPLALHRLRVAGELADIRSADLAFDAAECRALLAAQGVTLPDAALAHLVGVTEGWASGLRLAATALITAADPPAAAANFSGADAGVAEFVMQDLMGLDEERRHLLVSTCPVDEVCAPLAVAMSGNPRAASVLRELAAEDYLTCPRPGWYRQRTLVQQVLRSGHLANAPLNADLCRRAATWFEGQDEGATALELAVRSGDWDFAGGVALRAAATAAFLGDPRTLAAPLARVPEAAVIRRPELLIARAWAKYGGGDALGASAELHCVERNLALPEPQLTLATVSIRTLQAVLAHRRGDAPAMVSSATGAQEAMARLSPTEGPGWYALYSASTRLIAVAELWLGRPQRMIDLGGWEGVRVEVPALPDLTGTAWQGYVALAQVSAGLVQQAKQTASAALSGGTAGVRSSASAAPAWLALAVVALRAGDAAAAEQAIAMGTTCNAGVDAFLAVAFRLASARRNLTRGDLHGARQSLADLTRLHASDCPMPWLATLRTAIAAEVELAAGLPARAAAILATHDAQVAHGAGGWPGLDPDTLAIPRARVLLATHRAEEVAAAVAGLLKARGALQAEAWLMVSLAEDALRHDALATEALSHALDVADSEGLLQSFLLPHPRLEAMLHRHAEVVGTHRAFIDRALVTTGADRPLAGVVEIEPLTDRELSVLAYLPTLSSNSEIAEELSISVNTVKQHLKSIHRKLQVGSRRDAVRVARRLDLLPRQSNRR